jgi:hypothetical protein
MGPAQEAVVGAGYSDAVDEALRVQAVRWHMLDWASWTLTLSVGSRPGRKLIRLWHHPAAPGFRPWPRQPSLKGDR